MTDKKIVLAFSGGLDTSFCVPWLNERGFEVTTLFVDTGGVDAAERDYIASRATELGAARHVTTDASADIWNEVVVPLVHSGGWYQDQYPLLCSDRYIIVRKALELCDEVGTRNFAHGCTGMGNDQVRFDLTVRALGDYNIIAPIREIQQEGLQVREFEKQYLADRGIDVRDKTQTYTINENLLGVTISGAEIDRWEAPGPDTWQLTRPRSEWPEQPLRAQVTFDAGIPVALDGEAIGGAALLAELNRRFGAYGVGRGLYTGDTCVGLKGHIVYEAPGLTALHVAHRALEEATSTRHQNAFKPVVARQWGELVYQGFFYEPLKRDLEAYLSASQGSVSGTVTLETAGGNVHAVAIDSDKLLVDDNATYAQSAGWSVSEAEGFIKLFGQSSALWHATNKRGNAD
ncbi:MAG: argininosuccinate synthase [Gammaproteobacteria bacterium]|nr:argininosuccinate synthase [Gammaproteobacteria bacterium]NNF60929.1 argininosuccinate synthase [Gammaproteobacteria bacterium]NNM20854.1 argininosuccinate synthase [Gammaproteobacteria bacterium]